MKAIITAASTRPRNSPIPTRRARVLTVLPFSSRGAVMMSYRDSADTRSMLSCNSAFFSFSNSWLCRRFVASWV